MGEQIIISGGSGPNLHINTDQIEELIEHDDGRSELKLKDQADTIKLNQEETSITKAALKKK